MRVVGQLGRADDAAVPCRIVSTVLRRCQRPNLSVLLGVSVPYCKPKRRGEWSYLRFYHSTLSHIDPLPYLLACLKGQDRILPTSLIRRIIAVTPVVTAACPIYFLLFGCPHDRHDILPLELRTLHKQIQYHFFIVPPVTSA